jgi:hypothetical protein
MSMRYQAGIVTASYFPLKVPNAPTIGTASVASNTAVSITFTAPTNVGGGAITSYIATARRASDGTIVSATGASSPITITGLVTAATYTVTVAAVNAFGAGPSSPASNSVVVQIVNGQVAYTTAGTYSWVAPAEASSVSVVCVGGGGGTSAWARAAGGGGLGYKNTYSVTAGSSYTVVVGAAGNSGGSGGDSYFVSSSLVRGGGGGGTSASGAGGTYVGDGGGNGGVGQPSQDGGNDYNGGAGGAGGYSGNGGNGATSGTNAQNGSGGGGAGGYQVYIYQTSEVNGGGVGILGQGSNGLAPSGAGSGGSGKLYGGGGGWGLENPAPNYGIGGSGAVRIIWPGNTRTFPSTNTGNL